MERGPDSGILRVREHVHFFGRLVLCTALLSVISFLAAWTQTYKEFIPIWPSTGIGLALLWLHGARYWPAVFVSNALLSMVAGTPMLAATGNGSLEVLIAMTALWLLRRWNVRMSLPDMSQLFSFVAAVVLASSLAIPISALRMFLVFHFPPSRALVFGADLFLSEAFSFLVFTPLLVAWPHKEFPQGGRRWLFFAALFVLAAAGLGVWSVEPALQDRFLFLLLPIVVVCSVVAGVGGASAASTALAIILIAMANASASSSDILLRSFFVLSAALTGYLLAVSFRERENTAKEMEFRALHDALTGLANRDEFEHRVSQALQDASRPCTLIYLDLDQFRVVNDTSGHAAGDQLLRDVGVLLASTLREGEVVARLGGDEFAVLLEQHSTESALAIAEALRRAIHDFQFVHEGRSFWLSVSIGIVFPEGGVDTFEIAIANADRACYQAKEEGRNRIRLYAKSDRELVARREEIAWVSRLHLAIDQKRLQLHAQPIVSLADPPVSGSRIEILLRLIDEQGKLILPLAFIPAAERYGLMPTIDRWVVEEAFSRYAQRANANRMTNKEIWAINLSGATLGDDDFPAFLKDQFALHGLRFDAICFEVTETAAIANLSQARKFMREMRNLGCQFALDDFGAGASSFSYLQNLPVDYLKIDASFVTNIIRTPVKDVMVSAINQIGHAMGIKTIAEGVESQEALRRLGEIGVDYAQGSAIGIPRLLPPN